MTAASSGPHRAGKGFSLIEMLAVLAIIGILLTAASNLALPQPTPLQAAETTAAALEQARMDALASGRPTALLFLAEAGDPGRLTKFLTVRQSAEADPDQTTLWDVVAPPIEFGGGVLLKESSSTSNASGAPAATMNLPYRGGRQGEGPIWISYGFAGDGTPLQPAARLVFGRDTGNDPPRSTEDTALIMGTNGRPTPAFSFAALPE